MFEVLHDKFPRLFCIEGCNRNVWILSNPEKAAMARGTIVMTMLAGCVTMLRMAMVVKAVSVRRLPPIADIAAKNASVMAGENIPSALAVNKHVSTYNNSAVDTVFVTGLPDAL